MADTEKNTERKVEIWMGNLLRFGVLLATLVVLIGGAVYLFRAGSDTAARHTFHGEPVDLRRPGKIFEDALALDPTAIIQLGLLILIATPIARVAFSLFAFLWQRDITFILLTLFVLALLIFSLLAETV